MLLNATYNGNKVLLNTDYIVDVWNEDGTWKAYTLDNERGCYVIEDAELKKWLKESKE